MENKVHRLESHNNKTPLYLAITIFDFFFSFVKVRILYTNFEPFNLNPSSATHTSGI